MEIFNITGEIVLTSNLKQTNISRLYPAIYIALIKSKDGVLMKLERIIKK